MFELTFSAETERKKAVDGLRKRGTVVSASHPFKTTFPPSPSLPPHLHPTTLANCTPYNICFNCPATAPFSNHTPIVLKMSDDWDSVTKIGNGTRGAGARTNVARSQSEINAARRAGAIVSTDKKVRSNI
jgi:hypothetical protein